eukprot:6089566-Amphidinium_carterae.1
MPFEPLSAILFHQMDTIHFREEHFGVKVAKVQNQLASGCGLGVSLHFRGDETISEVRRAEVPTRPSGGKAVEDVGFNTMVHPWLSEATSIPREQNRQTSDQSKDSKPCQKRVP